MACGNLLAVAVLNDCHTIESIENRAKFVWHWSVAWLIPCLIFFDTFLVFGRESQAFRPGFIVSRLLLGISLIVILPGIPIARTLCDRNFNGQCASFLNSAGGNFSMICQPSVVRPLASRVLKHRGHSSITKMS